MSPMVLDVIRLIIPQLITSKSEFILPVLSNILLIYLHSHPVAYADYNATTWALANYTFPRNSLYDGC